MQGDIGPAALLSSELRDEVIDLKSLLFREGSVQCSDCREGRADLVPAGDGLLALRSDYEQMEAAGMLGDGHVPFTAVLDTLRGIEARLNGKDRDQRAGIPARNLVICAPNLPRTAHAEDLTARRSSFIRTMNSLARDTARHYSEAEAACQEIRPGEVEDQNVNVQTGHACRSGRRCSAHAGDIGPGPVILGPSSPVSGLGWPPASADCGHDPF